MKESTPAGGAVERTRLAPSPTGALHLGNVRTFLVNWALARRRGWRVLMRVEDLDTPRTKAGAGEAALGLLAWLGLDWDEGPVFQSRDLGVYEEAMNALASRGLVYRCALSRREIEAAASAPHEGDGEVRYPPELRPATLPAAFEPVDADDAGRGAGNWRFACPAGAFAVEDEFAGVQRLDPSASVGDFVVWTKRGHPSYQLAVAVDDARQGVTRVVRGDDLLDSTGRQLALYAALDRPAPLGWTHLPLVVGADGKRLAKRHGDTRLERYRAAGVRPERVVGLAAHLCGVTREPEEMTAGEFVGAFTLDTLPRGAAVFTPEHDAWLASGRST